MLILEGMSSAGFDEFFTFPAIINSIFQRFIGWKGEFMLQQIKIQTQDAKRLKPLLKSAIRSQLDDIEHGIHLTRNRLAAFEKQYGMSTAEFLRRFKPGEMEETLDFLDWQGETRMLALLEEKHAAFKDAQVK